MLALYYSPGACSLAPHILLEEAGAAFEPVRVAIAEGAHDGAAYRAINPRGRVPALVVDGAVITENIAVMTWIARAFPASGFIPADPLGAARAYELLSFFASSVHVAFAQYWRMERFTDDSALHPAIQRGGLQALGRFFAEIENLIGANSWLGGQTFGAVDAYPFVFHRWARRIGVDVGPYPAWRAHTARVLDRAAVRRALAREGLAATDFTAERAAG